MTLAPGLDVWLQALLVLGGGVATVVLVAFVASRSFRSARRRRAVWQIAVLALLMVTFAELSGTGEALVRVALVKLENSERTAPGPVELDGLTDRPEAPAGSAVAPPRGGGWNRDGSEGSIAPADSRRPDPEPPGTVRDPSAPQPIELAVTSRPGVPRIERPATGAGVPSPPLDADRVIVAGSGIWWPGLLWVLGSSLVATRLAVGGLLLALLRLRYRPLESGPSLERLRQLATRMGIRQRVSVREAPELDGPFTFGVLGPTIVLPAGFASSHTPAEQDAMLSHELAHVAGRDAAWSWMADAACAALWWHPLLWWCRGKLHDESEYAADEASSVLDDGPGLLAACLVELGGRMTRALPAGRAIQGRGLRSSLARRVKRLLRDGDLAWEPPRRFRPSAMKLLAAAAVLAAALTTTTWVRPGFSPGGREKGEHDMGLSMKHFWKRSLAGILCAAALTANSGPAPGQDGGGEVGEEGVSGDDAAADGAGDENTSAAEPGVGDDEGTDRDGEPGDGEDDGDVGGRSAIAKIELTNGRVIVGGIQFVQGGKKIRVTRPSGTVVTVARSDVKDLKLTGKYLIVKRRSPTARALEEARRMRDARRDGGGDAAADPGTVSGRRGQGLFGDPTDDPRRSRNAGGGLPGEDPWRGARDRGVLTRLSAGSVGIEWGGGSGMSLDLVSLATALTDAAGSLQISQVNLERAMKLAETNAVPRADVEIARIHLETSARKVEILRQVAESALRSSETLVRILEEERSVAKDLLHSGRTSPTAMLRIESQIAVAGGTAEILRSILGKSPKRRASGQPGTIELELSRRGDLRLDGARIDAEELGSELRSRFPRSQERKRVSVRIAVDRDIEAKRVRAIMDTLVELGFARVSLDTVDPGAPRP
ncbi:MAG: M56 family metallopeptidase [Planctomycetota bacterium]|nr:M56 family metallopeptidase [Planctomycetota bacterium]